MSGALAPLAAPLPDGTVGLFTTRYGGVSQPPWDELNLAWHVGDSPTAVAANRSRLALQLAGATLVGVDQVHGGDIVVVDHPGELPAERRADAMVTTLPGVALVVLVADCLPVLIADPIHRVVAAAHAGRGGLAAGVLQNTVAAMIDLGARAADCVAVIGPGVCGRCYQVPAAMRTEVAMSVPGSATTARDGSPALDLPAGAAELLEDSGVGQVQRAEICTMEDDRFYSYRRDGVTGRFAGVAMLADRD